jgi:hypothetical protein
MNASRKQAQATYNVALANVREKEMGTDLAAWEMATVELANARRALIEAEINFPTVGEKKRESRKNWMRNIGMDV